LLPVIIELATLCAILKAGLESFLFLMNPAIKLERLLGGDARIGTIFPTTNDPFPKNNTIRLFQNYVCLAALRGKTSKVCSSRAK
jgi:hypothetical protein